MVLAGPGAGERQGAPTTRWATLLSQHPRSYGSRGAQGSCSFEQAGSRNTAPTTSRWGTARAKAHPHLMHRRPATPSLCRGPALGVQPAQGSQKVQASPPLGEVLGAPGGKLGAQDTRRVIPSSRHSSFTVCRPCSEPKLHSCSAELSSGSITGRSCSCLPASSGEGVEGGAAASKSRMPPVWHLQQKPSREGGAAGTGGSWAASAQSGRGTCRQGRPVCVGRLQRSKCGSASAPSRCCVCRTKKRQWRGVAGGACACIRGVCPSGTMHQAVAGAWPSPGTFQWRGRGSASPGSTRPSSCRSRTTSPWGC